MAAWNGSACTTSPAWSGVFCKDGRVATVNISNLNLKGELIHRMHPVLGPLSVDQISILHDWVEMVFGQIGLQNIGWDFAEQL